MSWGTHAKCDICGALKVEVNHWFEVSVDASGELMIGPMTGAAGSGVEHICGQKCLHTRLGQWVAQTHNSATEGADNHGNSNSQ